MERNLYKDRNLNWDEEVDVAIIGSGFAGLAAAIEAKNTGKSVIVFEKMSAVGGNSIISDGGVAAPETSIQKKFGISDSKDLMYEDMLKSGLGLNYPQLVRIVVDKASEAFEWSRDYLGVEYLDRIDQFGGHSVARCYTAKNISGATIIKKQVTKAKELGVEIRLKTCFESFIMDADGCVIGIVLRNNYDYKNPDIGSEKYIKVKSGVVLATGGFGSDVEFRSAQDPRLTAKIDTTNKPFATAEALKEAMKIGAMPIQLSQIQLGPWASPDEKGYGDAPEFSEYILFQYGVIVDPKTGKRFVNELADRKTLSDKILSIDHPCVGVADAKAVKLSGWNIDRCLKKGVVRKFDTLNDLADFYQISYKELNEAINSFNDCVAIGVDKYFSKPILSIADQIKHAPFYGVRLWPKVHHTMGGISINERAEVLDIDGKPIEGLYAAGEVSGGIHGACRLGSCAITECFVFGRIAGHNAAK